MSIKRRKMKSRAKTALLLLVVVLLTACKAKEPVGSSVTSPPEAPTEQVTIPVTETPTPIPATPTPTPRISDINLDEVRFSGCGLFEDDFLCSEIPCNLLEYEYTTVYADAGPDEMCAFWMAKNEPEHSPRSYRDEKPEPGEKLYLQDGRVDESIIAFARMLESLGLVYFGNEFRDENNTIRGWLIIATVPKIKEVFGGENQNTPYGHWYWGIYAASREDFEQDTVVNVLMQSE